MFGCADACGGYIDGTNGTITSPFYPSIYPPNKNCIWLIVAPPQHRITITFNHFDVEGNNVGSNEINQSINLLSIKTHAYSRICKRQGLGPSHDRIRIFQTHTKKCMFKCMAYAYILESTKTGCFEIKGTLFLFLIIL